MTTPTITTPPATPIPNVPAAFDNGQAPEPRKGWVRRHKVLTGIGGAALAVGLVTALGSGGSSDGAATAVAAEVTTSSTAQAATKAPEEVVGDGATISQKNALRSAESYLDGQAFSKEGLAKQLAFEGFDAGEVKYATGTVKADWQAEANESAAAYVDGQAFSKSGLTKQLQFEGFSTKQATNATDQVNADWNAEAVESATAYLDSSSFSRSGLTKQLKFEGFTSKQASHAVDSVGL